MTQSLAENINPVINVPNSPVTTSASTAPLGRDAVATALTTLVTAATAARVTATAAAGGSHDSTPEIADIQTAIDAVQAAITAQLGGTVPDVVVEFTADKPKLHVAQAVKEIAGRLTAAGSVG